jgi:hypothetical protein
LHGAANAPTGCRKLPEAHRVALRSVADMPSPAAAIAARQEISESGGCRHVGGTQNTFWENGREFPAAPPEMAKIWMQIRTQARLNSGPQSRLRTRAPRLRRGARVRRHLWGPEISRVWVWICAQVLGICGGAAANSQPYYQNIFGVSPNIGVEGFVSQRCSGTSEF